MDPQLQKVRVQLQRTDASLYLSHIVVVVVLVQLCVSDCVEDLMETLTMESEKPLTFQEPDIHQRLGPAAVWQQGENINTVTGKMEIQFCNTLSSISVSSPLISLLSSLSVSCPIQLQI